MKTDKKRVVGRHFKYVLFRLDPIDVFVLTYQLLLNNLHSVNSFCLFQFD